MTAPSTAPCNVCPHHCAPAEGGYGLCRARVARDGQVVSANYGQITAMALDPVEKKPLAMFRPGGMVLSVGSFGYNLRCAFCQNHGISQTGAAPGLVQMTPETLCGEAEALIPQGNIGLAFTYNEPAVGWEFVRDASRLAKARGMQSVMVTNGCFCPEILDELLESIDAFNIDLKCFTAQGYRELGGDLETVKATIATAAKRAHVEVTTLVVPGLSDSEADMEAEAAFLAGISPALPLHISRYFPRWQAQQPATPVPVLHRLASIAQAHLDNVFLGNV